MNSHVFELTWGSVALVGGGLLAANVRGLADWFQAMSYDYKSWPSSVITCRVLGGAFALAGTCVLVNAAL